MEKIIDWTTNKLRIKNKDFGIADKEKDLRTEIEPWLTAIFQSEHLSLLIGNGLSIATSNISNAKLPTFGRLEFDNFSSEIGMHAEKQSNKFGRGVPNFEDDLRAALDLQKGLELIDLPKSETLQSEIDEKLNDLINGILKTEKEFANSPNLDEGEKYLKSFLMSFASRTATRDRLHIFTTNYDRIIEYGCDQVGLLLIDRFIGKITPVLRTTRLELDYHYNPPGIRGEPRYVEGVARYTKLHGSIDWKFSFRQVNRIPLAFGSIEESKIDNPFEHAVIYPNPAKDIETAFFPYAELFRDFGFASCRPNSALVTFGYSFGDSHINRIIDDMLTIPSTHLVIISYDDESGRIKEFLKGKNESQISILIGNEFGDLKNLVDKYLPKSAIDRLSTSTKKIIEKRVTFNDSLSKTGIDSNE